MNPTLTPGSPRSLLDEVRDETRLLDRRESAARALLKAVREAKRSAQLLQQPRYLTTASALAALDLDQHEVVTAAIAMLDPGWESAHHTALLLLGEAGAGSMPAVHALMAAFRLPNEMHRSTASHSMGDMGPIAAEPLIDALGSPDPIVRARAIEALGWVFFQGRVARPPIGAIVALLDDPDAAVRGHAAGALGFIGCGAAPALPALVSHLSDPVEMVRNMVLFAIGSLEAAAVEAIPALFDACADPSPIVRAALAVALHRLGTAAYQPSVEALSRPEPRRRALGIRTLDLLRKHREASLPATASDMEVALAPHRHTEGEVRDLLRRIETGDVTLTSETEPQHVNGDVHYQCSNGWEIVVYNDVGQWDYLDEVASPDGRVTGHSAMNAIMPGVADYEPAAEVAWEAYGFAGAMQSRDERWRGWQK